jgi:hypothetical protein
MKLLLRPKDEGDSLEALVLNNLQIVDQLFHVELMAAAALAWFKCNRGKNYVNLERFLREHRLNTHLFANKTRMGGDVVLHVPEQKEQRADLEYECWFSCRPRQVALEEVLKHWPSYESNLIALERAGSATLRKGGERAEAAEGHRLHLVQGASLSLCDALASGAYWLVRAE